MPSRARRPVVTLVSAALVPALGLGALAWVARQQAHQQAHPTTVAAPPDSVPGLLLPALLSPLLSVRRAPAVLAGDRRFDVLAASTASLAGAIDDTSCLSIELNDQSLATHNNDVAVIPASNLKLIIAAVALDVLGAGTTFTTTVVGPAPVNGVIAGDVYLVGGGDPVLSERWYMRATSNRKRPPLHATDVNALADALVASGVTRITGKVLGDGGRYDDESYPPGWGNDIRAVSDGAPVGALVINDSLATSGAQSNKPAASAAAAFAGLLNDRGISVEGGSGTGTAPVGAAILSSVTSATLIDVVNEMLVTSDNLTAEMLVKEVAHVGAQPGTRVAGLQAVTDRLVAWGVPMGGVVLTDGSGLSRDNRLTCAALAAVLRRGSATDAVGNGLARGGQPGSTLADSFQQAGLAGEVRAKTGSLGEVKALSGYFVIGSDEVAFVLILNGASATNYTASWDQLAAALLAAAASPGSDALAPVVNP